MTSYCKDAARMSGCGEHVATLQTVGLLFRLLVEYPKLLQATRHNVTAIRAVVHAEELPSLLRVSKLMQASITVDVPLPHNSIRAGCGEDATRAKWSVRGFGPPTNLLHWAGTCPA
jgi:hypothetical protein